MEMELINETLYKELLNKSAVQSLHEDDYIYDVPIGITLLLCLLYGTISLLAVLGNSLVIWIVVTTRQMQTVTNWYIANLAMADVIIGAFAIPFQVSSFPVSLLQFNGGLNIYCICPTSVLSSMPHSCNGGHFHTSCASSAHLCNRSAYRFQFSLWPLSPSTDTERSWIPSGECLQVLLGNSISTHVEPYSINFYTHVQHME